MIINLIVSLVASIIGAFLGTQFELRSYKKKKEYDDERENYKKLMAKIVPALAYTSSLFPMIDSLPSDDQEREKFIRQRYNMAFEAQLEYWMFLQENRPFWEKNFYKELEKISTEMRCIQKMYTWKFFVEGQKIAAKSAEEEYKEKCLILRENVLEKVSNLVSEKLSTESQL